MPGRDDLPWSTFYQGRILNFAHRGAREQAPENTLPAFVRAADLGADGVELDVQLSADGVPVVIHDPLVDRTTDGVGAVAAMPLAALRELDAGAPFSPAFTGTPIPTLSEVFEALGSCVLFNVELKSSGAASFGSRRRLAQAVADAVRTFGLAARVLCSSFDLLTLRALRQAAPELLLGCLYSYPPTTLVQGWLARLAAGRDTALHPHFSMVDGLYMQRARRRGQHVNVWTVNEPDDIRRMRDLGVDAIISDRPEVVRTVLHGER